MGSSVVPGWHSPICWDGDLTIHTKRLRSIAAWCAGTRTRIELKPLWCQSLVELKVELRKAKERLRHKRDVILGCIKQPGFKV
jgi:hypothetical protein